MSVGRSSALPGGGRGGRSMGQRPGHLRAPFAKAHPRKPRTRGQHPTSRGCLDSALRCPGDGLRRPDRARRAFRGHRPRPGGVAVVTRAAPRVRDARLVAAGACSASPADGRFQGPPRCRFSGGGAVATGGEVTAREQGGPGETVESRLSKRTSPLSSGRRRAGSSSKVAGSRPVVRSPFLPARRASRGRPPAS
jgi:hypothetical protein